MSRASDRRSPDLEVMLRSYTLAALGKLIDQIATSAIWKPAAKTEILRAVASELKRRDPR